MNSTISLFVHKYKEVGLLIFRNVFILINLIIFSVVILLIYVGNTKEGMFLGIIVFLNIVIGISQDLRAWLVLEKLNLLTALSVIRINSDGSESSIPPEELIKSDKVKLKLGDQIPRDGQLESSNGFEVNNALVTGESASFRKNIGDQMLAGSIVTAGSGVMKVTSAYEESRIAKMTVKVKKYSRNASPVQGAIEKVVAYSGYSLLAVIIFVVIRSQMLHTSMVSTVQQIGSLSSMLVPQGLIIATTLLFAYGATHLFNRHVLLQEMNAVEKLGHIRNLCMDKTGTLTENLPTVEEMLLPAGMPSQVAEQLASIYIHLTHDSSQTIRAIGNYLSKDISEGVIEAEHPFSSWRKYSGLLVESVTGGALFLGAPEVLAKRLTSEDEKKWLEAIIEEHTRKGKRVIALMQSSRHELLEDLTGTNLSVVAVFILENNLREGIPDAIDYFQKRGVRIRVISGDNLETVRKVVTAAGILGPDQATVGDELELWSEKEFDEKVRACTIFARIKPEQKELIITSLKKDGFTAMVGDGANDALAIKMADLGIAMFDGAKATRQLAGVVLTHNSFVELPGGVKLADSVIENIEIYASLFFSQTFFGFLFFVMLTILGYDFPFTPLNITFINYFAVGVPSLLIFYWVIHPREEYRPINKQSFLKRVLPFSFISAIPQSVMAVCIVLLVGFSGIGVSAKMTSILSFIVLGYVFFMFAPRMYGGFTSRARQIQLLLFAIIETALLFVALQIPFAREFFNITSLPLTVFIFIIPPALIYALIQYVISSRMALSIGTVLIDKTKNK